MSVASRAVMMVTPAQYSITPASVTGQLCLTTVRHYRCLPPSLLRDTLSSKVYR